MTQNVAGRDANLDHPDRAGSLSLPVPNCPIRIDCNTTVRAALPENVRANPCPRTDAAPQARATRPHAAGPPRAPRPKPHAEKAQGLWAGRRAPRAPRPSPRAKMAQVLWPPRPPPAQRLQSRRLLRSLNVASQTGNDGLFRCPRSEEHTSELQ